MTLVVPNSGELRVGIDYISSIQLFLKLYSNNRVPGELDTVASYTEVIGGGYAQVELFPISWNATQGDPTVFFYPVQTFEFTGPTDSPNTIYGYYILDGAGLLRWVERFNETVVPFIPAAGHKIRITPRFEIS